MLLAACGGLVEKQRASPQEGPHVIYVVEHGWHAGIALARADVDTLVWPEQQDFPGAAYLEVGWGDAGYYPNPAPGLGATLKAGLWPTPSVLHVAGFNRPPPQFFSNSEVIRVRLTEKGLDALARYIREAYARDDEGQVLPVGEGLYGDSRFYYGSERYHVFNNCNHWVARALRAAGYPASVTRALTVGSLLRQVRSFGEVIQQPDEASVEQGIGEHRQGLLSSSPTLFHSSFLTRLPAGGPVP